MGRGGAKLRDSKSPRNSKSRGAPSRRQERLGVRGARTRSGSRSPGGSRSPASRLESMIGGLSDESELSSSSSDEEALRRQRARTLQAAESRRGSPTPGDVRQQVRRYMPRYSDSDSDSDSDVSPARSPRPRRSTRGSAVRLDLTGIERALDHDHWPTPGAATPGCLHCRFVWDPDGEFERHKVEGTVRDLMEGKAVFGDKKHERLSERQGEELLRELRYIAHMQRRGAVAVRRANMLDATSFATGAVLPLLLAISFHYGLLAISSVETGLECSDGGGRDGCAVAGEGSFYLLSLLCLLLSVISVGTHLYEKLSSIRTRGEREVAVAAEMKEEFYLYLEGEGPYDLTRASGSRSYAMLMAKLQHLASEAGAARAALSGRGTMSLEAAGVRGSSALRRLRAQQKYAAASQYSMTMSGRA